GDVNADGKVTSADAVALLRFLLTDGTLADWQAGDLNADGTITAVDLSLL
ncbi:MAG TPA: lysophospholipase, partial [Ruminococcus sp.]|nr:lysophospholipase [Ruminococcus sp.]